MSAEVVRVTVKNLSDLDRMVPHNCSQMTAVHKDGQWSVALMCGRPVQGTGGAA